MTRGMADHERSEMNWEMQALQRCRLDESNPVPWAEGSHDIRNSNGSFRTPRTRVTCERQFSMLYEASD